MTKSFSEYAVEKIKDVIKNSDNHVGSELKKAQPIKYKDFIASDCITMAIWVLKHAFTKTARPTAASRVGGLGEKGSELAKYLINQHGWKGVYYNPDVNHPLDGSGEHIASYYNQVKKYCYYSVGKVPVHRKVINYKPSSKKVTSYLNLTKKTVVDYNIFKSVPFGVGMSRGGTHVWLYSYGKVYESHWDKEAKEGLYTALPLTMFPWLSGVVIVPPDAHHMLTMAKVKCG